MKKLSYLLIVAMLFTMNACKKGEEDPFLSFKSRDKRIIGTWLLTAFESSSVTKTTSNTSNSVNDNTYQSTSTTTTTMAFDGTKITDQIVEVASSETNAGYYDGTDWVSEKTKVQTNNTEKDVTNIELTLTLNDDWSYELSVTGTDKSTMYDFSTTTTIGGTPNTVANQDTETFSPGDTFTSTEEGTWGYVGPDGNYTDDAKTDIQLWPSGMGVGLPFDLGGHLLRLASKELIVVNDWDDNDNTQNYTDYEVMDLASETSYNVKEGTQTSVGTSNTTHTSKATYEKQKDSGDDE